MKMIGNGHCCDGCLIFEISKALSNRYRAVVVRSVAALERACTRSKFRSCVFQREVPISPEPRRSTETLKK